MIGELLGEDGAALAPWPLCKVALLEEDGVSIFGRNVVNVVLRIRRR